MRTVAEIVEPCASCGFWDSSPARPQPTQGSGGRAAKRTWLASVEQEWGSPGWSVHVDDHVAGHLILGPAHLVPRALAFPTAPVFEDALVLVAARIAPPYAGQGLGRVLLQTAARQTLSRGYRAIEAIASRAGDPCLLPAEYLEAVGFHAVREHASFPRMRLDLRTALAWREDIEHALERLLAPVRRLGEVPTGTATRGDQP
ncbi:MAG: GNAT family N-acetyltransferase [Actinomycetales bacterium]|nr:GNAT family N-acetyltransferase [Actinomycetales bacterium]